MKKIAAILFLVILAFCLPALADAEEITRYVSDNAQLKAAFEEANALAEAAKTQNKEMDFVNIILTDDIEITNNFAHAGKAPTMGMKFAAGAKVRLRSEEGKQYRITSANAVVPYMYLYQGAKAEITNVILDGSQNGSVISYCLGGSISMGSGVVIENFKISSDMVPGIWLMQIGGAPTLKMDGVTMRNNKCIEFSRGAIMVSAPDGKVIINNCTFENNTTERGFGGVIHSNADMIITDSTFVSNTADAAGAVFAIGAEVIIENCEFKNNRAYTDLDPVGGNGGGALQFQDGSVVTITNCDFTGNTTDSAGGVLLAYVDTEVTFNHCNMIDNEAEDHGGAIAVAGEFSQDETKGSTIYLNDCLLEKNVAHGKEVQNDQVNSPDSPGGGAIFLHEYCKAYLNEGTIIRENYAAYCGGAAYVGFGGHLILDGAEIYDNEAALDGGAVYLDGTGAYNGYDHSNSMRPNPDNSFATGGTLTMKDGIITNNTAGRNGGGVYIYGENEVVVDDVQYIYTGGKAYMTGGIITQNTAKDMGGGVYVGACDTGEKGGVLQMVDGAICNNVAGENGNSSTGENDAGADVYSEGGNAYITLIGADAVTAYILDADNTHVPAAYRRMRFTNWYDDYSDQDPTYGKSAEKIGTGTNTGRYETSIDPDRMVYTIPHDPDNAYNALILDKEELPEVPATGDVFPAQLLAALLLVSAAAGVILKKKLYA